MDNKEDTNSEDSIVESLEKRAAGKESTSSNSSSSSSSSSQASSTSDDLSESNTAGVYTVNDDTPSAGVTSQDEQEQVAQDVSPVTLLGGIIPSKDTVQSIQEESETELSDITQNNNDVQAVKEEREEEVIAEEVQVIKEEGETELVPQSVHFSLPPEVIPRTPESTLIESERVEEFISSPTTMKETVERKKEEEEHSEEVVSPAAVVDVSPDAVLAFAFCLSGHAYIALFSWLRWWLYDDDSEGYIWIPIWLMAVGGVVDNWRLFLGVLRGKLGLDETVTSLAMVLRFTCVPLVWLTLGELLSLVLSVPFVAFPFRVMSVALCVHGFNEFMAQVHGHYNIASHGQVIRHVLDPFQVPYGLAIQPVLMYSGAVILAALNMFITGDWLSFVAMAGCFGGQAFAARSPQNGPFLASFLEVTFLVDLAYMYMTLK